ncbi:MAG: fibronectin type III domain-containing protein [Reinekea sp.]|jgi:hypothetical protein
MKIIHLVSAITLCFALMGCQLQVSGLGSIAPTEEAMVNYQANSDANNIVTEIEGATVEAANAVINLYWSAPLTRLNGEAMSLSDIGGYEIRYKTTQDENYYRILITDNSIDQYSLDSMDNDKNYTFEVAAFDTNGIYSNFVIAN